jgi:hypothetical protein
MVDVRSIHSPLPTPTAQTLHLLCQMQLFPFGIMFQQEQPTVPHWQDSCDPLQQGGSDMYAQSSALSVGMESNVHHEAVFHSMGEPSMNHGQPVYGAGMEQYEAVFQQQQQGVFHEMLPPQQHYHPLPPPVMVSTQSAMCLVVPVSSSRE